MTDLDLAPIQTSYFRQLRQSDPLRNLAERYETLLRGQPEATLRLFSFVPQVIEQGWAVLAPEGEPMLYSVGLSYENGLPELMLVTAGQPQGDMLRLLTMLARVQLEGGAALPAYDDLAPLMENEGFTLVSLKFEPYSPSVQSLFPADALSRFHEAFGDRDLSLDPSAPVLVARAYASQEAGVEMLRKRMDERG